MDFDQLVEEYLKENEETINKEELLEITKLFYSFVRQEIESGNLNQVRIKYFGSFRPMLGKLKHLRQNINWDKFNDKEKERYNKLFKNYDELIKEIETQP